MWPVTSDQWPHTAYSQYSRVIWPGTTYCMKFVCKVPSVVEKCLFGCESFFLRLFQKQNIHTSVENSYDFARTYFCSLVTVLERNHQREGLFWKSILLIFQQILQSKSSSSSGALPTGVGDHGSPLHSVLCCNDGVCCSYCSQPCWQVVHDLFSLWYGDTIWYDMIWYDMI